MSFAAHDPAMKRLTKRRRLRLRQSHAQTAVFVFTLSSLSFPIVLWTWADKTVGTNTGVADDFGVAFSIPGCRSV
jgi:hypothetical protein